MTTDLAALDAAVQEVRKDDFLRFEMNAMPTCGNQEHGVHCPMCDLVADAIRAEYRKIEQARAGQFSPRRALPPVHLRPPILPNG